MASDGWKTLRRAIPDGESKAVAHRLHLHEDHVRRWRRKPFSDDAPLSNGQRSPLDRFCALLDAVFLSYPTGAALLLSHVQNHHETLVENALLNSTDWDPRLHAAATLQETVDAVKCLNLNAPDDETLKELLEAQLQIEVAIKVIRTRRPQRGEGDAARESESGVRGERSGLTQGNDHAN
jgi:hypothetical protein